MLGLARLLTAPVLNETVLVGESGRDRPVAGVTLIESLDELQRPAPDQLLVMTRALSEATSGHRLDTALSRAGAHGAAAVCLFRPAGWEPSLTVRDLLRRLRAEGRCILLTSHIMQEVAALADRIVILAGGRIVLHGTPAELRRATGLSDLEEIFMAATAQQDIADVVLAAGE